MLKNRKFAFEFWPATFFGSRDAFRRIVSGLGAKGRRLSPFAAYFRLY
jgi:hypothetical protein